MDRLDSNNRWLMAAIAMIALLGAFTIGAAIAGTTTSGESANPGAADRENR